MDRSSVITLIKKEYTQDAIGQQVAVESERDIYAQVSSVSGTEWHSAGRNGIRAELRFIIFAYDYDDEEIIKYNGVTYSVYRTYMSNTDNLELYVKKKAGNE